MFVNKCRNIQNILRQTTEKIFFVCQFKESGLIPVIQSSAKKDPHRVGLETN